MISFQFTLDLLSRHPVLRHAPGLGRGGRERVPGLGDLAGDEPSRAALDRELAILVLDPAVHDHMGGLALHLEAFEDAAVALRMVGPGAARAGRGRVVEDDVGVAAHGDRALAWIEA